METKTFILSKDNHSFIFKVCPYGVDVFEAMEGVTCGQSDFMSAIEARQEYKKLLGYGYTLENK